MMKRVKFGAGTPRRSPRISLKSPRSLSNWGLKLLCYKLLLLVLVFSPSFEEAAQGESLFYFGGGGQQTISGSLHVLETPKGLYLVDIGSFMGPDGSNYPWPQNIPVDKIRAVFITHVHADHIGRLPLLLRAGYRGPIYLSRVSYELAKIILPSNLQFLDFGQERFYYCRHEIKRGKIPVYLDGCTAGERSVIPANRIYFTMERHRLAQNGFFLARAQQKKLRDELLARLSAQARIVDPVCPLDGPSFTVDDFQVQFLATPHIAGSVMVKLNYRGFRLLFSGDIGPAGSSFLPANPRLPLDFKVLVLEGSYVGRRVIDFAQSRREFREKLAAWVKAGYRVVIPAFVLDRSQQVMFEISRAMADGLLPAEQKIRVCSPTANRLLLLYADFVNRKDEFSAYFQPGMVRATDFLPPGYRAECRGPDPDNPLGLRHGEIGIMSSAMAEYASAFQALLDYLEDPKTVFVFVSYQAPGTPGGRLTSGATPPRELKLGNQTRQVLAKIYHPGAFSGHADAKTIIQMVAATRPRKILLVHLDPRNAPVLVDRYQQAFPQATVIVPRLGERHRLL